MCRKSLLKIMTTVKVNYKGSGVKTLSVFATLFYILGFAALVFSLTGLLLYKDGSGDLGVQAIGVTLASAFLPTSVFMLFSAAVCSALSGIARTALYKRALLEQEYEFLS
jgi:hypothetical protein